MATPTLTLANSLTQVKNLPFINAAEYNFSWTNGSGVSGSLASSGAGKVLTFTFLPTGIAATSYIYLAGGTGTAEAALVTATTGTAGGPGTITVTTANTHTGAWSVQSATAGIQEALYTITAPGGIVVVPSGSYTIYAQIYVPYQLTAWIRGAGRSATVLNVASTFSLSHAGVFNFSPSQVTATNSDSGGVKGLTISFTQPDSTNVATYTHWPPAVYASGNNHVTVDDVIIQKAWDAITSPLSNGVTINNVGMSFFHRGVTIDNCFDTLAITHLEGWVFGLTANQTTAFTAISTNNYLLDFGEVDLGWLDDVITDSGKFATIHKNGSGATSVIIGSNIDMDSNGGFEMSNGYVRLSNVSVSLLPGAEAFVVTGGTLSLDGVSIFNSGATATHFLYNASEANSGACAGLMPGMTISNLKVSGDAEDGFVVYGTSSSPFSGVAVVRVAGAEIRKQPGVAYTKSIFATAPTSGTGSVIMDVSHAHVNDNASVSAPFADFTTDLNHSLSFCDAPGGWDLATPAGTRVLYNSGMPTLGIPIFANNAAAVTGGLSKGQFYRTGADPDVVCIVH